MNTINILKKFNHPNTSKESSGRTKYHASLSYRDGKEIGTVHKSGVRRSWMVPARLKVKIHPAIRDKRREYTTNKKKRKIKMDSKKHWKTLLSKGQHASPYMETLKEEKPKAKRKEEMKMNKRKKEKLSQLRSRNTP